MTNPVAWRVVKMSTFSHFEYVALEFDMFKGILKEIRVNCTKTEVRKRTTTEFEEKRMDFTGCSSWETLSYTDVPPLMHEFNNVREKNGLLSLSEKDVKHKLYALEGLR